MRYVAVGELPRKRHVQVRDNGRLLVEEVMGYEGFSGNESILYHLQSPCRLDEVGSFTPDRPRRVGARRPRPPACRHQSRCRRAGIPSPAAGC